MDTGAQRSHRLYDCGKLLRQRIAVASELGTSGSALLRALRTRVLQIHHRPRNDEYKLHFFFASPVSLVKQLHGIRADDTFWQIAMLHST